MAIFMPKEERDKESTSPSIYTECSLHFWAANKSRNSVSECKSYDSLKVRFKWQISHILSEVHRLNCDLSAIRRRASFYRQMWHQKKNMQGLI